MVVKKIVINRDLKIGSKIPPNYIVDEIIGKGGTGVVYKAHKDGRPYKAIKVLRKDLSSGAVIDSSVLDAELKVSMLMGSNPYLVSMEDYGVMPDGLKYLVYPFIEGYSLEELNEAHIKKGCLMPFDLTAFILHRVTSFLNQAHNLEEEPIIHADLCPNNVIVQKGSGNPLILDCGGGESFKKGFVLGKPCYASPEILYRDDKIPLEELPLLDIYGVGILGYELLVGKNPFKIDENLEDESQWTFKEKYDKMVLSSVRRRCIDVPKELSDIVRACMSYKSTDRPIAEDLFDIIGNYLYSSGFGVTAETVLNYFKFFNGNLNPVEELPNNRFGRDLEKIINSKTRRTHEELEPIFGNVPRTFEDAFGKEAVRKAIETPFIETIYAKAPEEEHRQKISVIQNATTAYLKEELKHSLSLKHKNSKNLDEKLNEWIFDRLMQDSPAFLS